ncbi:MAG: enolase C-terminal domain-like protein [Candidatus Brocadiia bacterium]
MAPPTIADVQVFCTQPTSPNARLVIVKVITSEPGLHGLGCATFTQRFRAVQAAVVHHLGPRVKGRDPRRIEDLWHTMMVSGYWRNGPVLNNAVSGIDMALWDIKGKLAGVPCYELWGGMCRPGAASYAHADGRSPDEVADKVRCLMEQGYRHVRCQLGGYTGVEAAAAERPEGASPGAYYDPKEKLRRVPALFEYLRAELGDEIELLHDVHERLAPIDAVRLAKDLEPYRLFFLEDVLAPEDQEWLTMLRAQTATPIAMGELFNNPQEIVPFVTRRLFDYVRVHLSQIGGITPALKLAHLCEPFGIRTAWHGPGDVSPVGMAANVHLDVALHNLGIQEGGRRTESERGIFPGTPELREGVLYPNDKPGLGMEFDEDAAARYPCDDSEPGWTEARLPDGTIHRP